jgi:hypothetical protein
MPGYSEARLPPAEFSTETKSGLVLVSADFKQLTLQLKYSQTDKVKT